MAEVKGNVVESPRVDMFRNTDTSSLQNGPVAVNHCSALNNAGFVRIFRPWSIFWISFVTLLSLSVSSA